MRYRLACLLFILLVAELGAQSTPYEQRARAIFKELIEINTTDTPAGNVTTAADAAAARLKAAGWPDADLQVIGPNPRKHNLVARFHGTGAKRPLLLLAHLDVVERSGRTGRSIRSPSSSRTAGSMAAAPAMTRAWPRSSSPT